FPDDLSLARRRTRSTWSLPGSEGSPGQGDLARAGRIRHVCPQARALVSAGRPRPPARRPAQGRLAGLTGSPTPDIPGLTAAGRVARAGEAKTWGQTRVRFPSHPSSSI